MPIRRAASSRPLSLVLSLAFMFHALPSSSYATDGASREGPAPLSINPVRMRPSQVPAAVSPRSDGRPAHQILSRMLYAHAARLGRYRRWMQETRAGDGCCRPTLTTEYKGAASIPASLARRQFRGTFGISLLRSPCCLDEGRKKTPPLRRGASLRSGLLRLSWA
jgi:hypothetical protein